MTPLAVDPSALSAAGGAVAAAGDALAAALGGLVAGFSANTGQDAAGEVFGLAYQDAAQSLLRWAAAGINALRFNGAKIELCASNYSLAEVASTLGGGSGVVPAPGVPVKIAAPGAPGTLGPGVAAPLLWAVVEGFVGDLWPNGDAAGLHAAARRWREFAGALGGVQGALSGARSVVAGQDMPEGALIVPVLSTMGTDLASMGAQCDKLAGALDGFAEEVAHTQNAIRDLLSRLGSVSGLLDEFVLIVEGDGLAEIKKIAADITAVLRNVAREARAQEQVMKLGMQVVDGLVCRMEKFVRGQLTRFLGEEVGNPVATVFDTWVNANEGVLKGGVGLVEGIEELDPRRFLIDPQGAADTWKGLTKTGLINHVLNPREAVEADKQMFKALLHLEDWRTDRPGLGFGENVFDVATLFLPGVGEAGAGAEGAAAGVRAAEAGADAADAAAAAGRGGRVAGGVGGFGGASAALGDIGMTGRGLSAELENLGRDVPKADPQLGARPVGWPAWRPVEAPVEPRPRLGESGSPGKGPTHWPIDPPVSAAPRPGGPVGPHDPLPVGAAAAHPGLGPGEHLASSTPQVADAAPVRVPGSAEGSLVEPAPAAAHSSQPAPAPTSAAPHASTPQSPPSASRPAELPTPHGGPHGPSNGDPHGPGEKEPGSPQEGTPDAPSGEGAGQDDGGSCSNPYDALTSSDLSALADYTGSGYQDLNSALRSDVLDASQHARIEALNDALEKLRAYHGPVVRGTDLPPEVLAQYQPGEVITENAFLSTTTNPAVARSPGFAGNVEFRILSNTGRDISSVSMFPGEQEVLFPAGTKFYIVNRTVDPMTGRTIIEMIER